MKNMKRQLRGPEAKGIDIVSCAFTLKPPRSERINKWNKYTNSFIVDIIFNFQTIVNKKPIDSILKLFPICASFAAFAPWPPVVELSSILGKKFQSAEIQAINMTL